MGQGENRVCLFFPLPNDYIRLPLIEKLFEFSGVGGFKLHNLSRYGVIKAEFEGMQSQSSNRIYIFHSISSVSNNGVT